MNVDDGLMAVALGEAAHRSIEAGRPVELASLVPADVWQEIREGRAARRQRRKETKRTTDAGNADSWDPTADCSGCEAYRHL